MLCAGLLLKTIMKRNFNYFSERGQHDEQSKPQGPWESPGPWEKYPEYALCKYVYIMFLGMLKEQEVLFLSR